MSTRGFYVFKDQNGRYNVYRHHDNYPESKEGGFAAIGAACAYAWLLPRFEADEFAASFVAANKRLPDPEYRAHSGGGVRLMKSGPWCKVCPADVEYLYVIEQTKAGPIYVTCYKVSCNWSTYVWGKPVMIFRETLQNVAAGWYPERKEAAE